jgi:hypothetical protein
MPGVIPVVAGHAGASGAASSRVPRMAPFGAKLPAWRLTA